MVMSLVRSFYLACVMSSVVLSSGCRDKKSPDASPAPATPLASAPPARDTDLLTKKKPAKELAIDPEAIIIGFDADMSSSGAEAGESIRRGAILALKELNAKGGVLGRPFQLVVRDHRGNPARGIDNIESLAALPNLVAVLGGLHTPVVLAELDVVHEKKIVFLIPWAAGTPIVDNGKTPNFVFRVSVRDEFAGSVMVKHAVANGCKKLGLLLERTPWGRSNLAAISEAITRHEEMSMLLEWLLLGTLDLTAQIQALVNGGVECVILVSNPLEGQAAIRSMAEVPAAKRRPIISHWGILGAGRKLFSNLKPVLKDVDLTFLQSYSFFNPAYPKRADRVVAMYQDAFEDARTVSDIFSPTGTAHAYELVHLLAQAIRAAGTLDRVAVRDALETLPTYEGLIRDFAPPFTAERHDALTADDLQICRFDDRGAIVPVSLFPSRGDR